MITARHLISITNYSITKMWTVLLLCVFQFFASGNLLELRDPAYTLNFASPIYVCPDEESQAFVDTSEVDVKRLNETTAMMTGTIKFLKGFQQETMIEVIIEKDVDGGLEMVLSHEICDVCKEFSDPISIYKDYFKFFGFPEMCPFEPNSYSIKDFVADTDNLPINSETAGRYQVTMNLFRNTDGKCLTEKLFIACLKLDFLVELL